MPTHYVSRTYIDLWTAVELHAQRESDTPDKDQRLAARLSALVLTFFTLEAYLNHLGMMVRPDLWEGNNERKYFSGRKEIDGQRFYGPIGKLQFLYAQCGLIYDKASDEMQTIQKLKEFRDLLAHGRTEEDSLPISSSPGQRPERIVPQIWQYIQSNLREDAYTHVRKVVEQLHAAAITTFPSVNIESAAFVSSFFQITDVI
ncbi:MAG: hypothetical protein ABIF87_07685 [Pseudomonadota bacterium]